MFGIKSACDVRANPCFTRYLSLNPTKWRPLDLPDIKAKILADCDAWRLDLLLINIRGILNGEPEEADQELWTKRLLTYAVGIDMDHKNFGIVQESMATPNSHVWSFCRNTWVPRHRVVHCEQCGVCYENAWHCELCGTCKAGRYLACDGCDGWSTSGVWDGEEGRKAPNAQTAQRGRSAVSPKKRVRQVSPDPWNDSVSEVSVYQPSFSCHSSSQLTNGTPDGPSSS